MNIDGKNIKSLKFYVIAIWFITWLLIIIGLRQFTEFVAFVLTKLYEFFIERIILM